MGRSDAWFGGGKRGLEGGMSTNLAPAQWGVQIGRMSPPPSGWSCVLQPYRFRQGLRPDTLHRQNAIHDLSEWD